MLFGGEKGAIFGAKNRPEIGPALGISGTLHAALLNAGLRPLALSLVG